MAWYANETNSKLKHEAWERCYKLACMYRLPKENTEIKSVEYFYSKNLRFPKKFDESIDVAYTCSDSFAPICGISVASLIENSNDNQKYDIIVLHCGGISELNKNLISSLAIGRSNISIRFVNCSNEHIGDVSLRGYHTKESYLRSILLTDYFSLFDKILYLDSDTIINSDVDALYSINLGSNVLAAAKDVFMEYLVNANRSVMVNGTLLSYRYYLKEILKLKNNFDYFNSGVLVMNLKELRNLNCFNRVCEMLSENVYNCFEQCVFNKLFQGRVHFIPLIWNLQDGYEVLGQYEKFASENTKKYLKWSIPRYKIKHYLGGSKKPWYYPTHEFAAPFIKYASKTPWFEALIYAALANEAPEFIEKYNENRKEI